ncbi:MULTISPECIES: hypothetical protein [Corallococcus]|uniref:hypothetical protein n=1 Tax=Corallococcus TaxID=83461 RepID=UPI000EA07096|nr:MULTISPECIES: hypothetical protein [Corallococcus]RKH93778.1 hypothetical protein D7Y04_38795 [Corallococcus sp. AB038B]
MAIGAAMLLVSCGPEAAQEVPAEAQASQSDRPVRAMAPPNSCDPFEDDGWCPVSSNKITCFNGVQMDAYWTPDGWCINADVCKNYGGPWGCPEW